MIRADIKHKDGVYTVRISGHADFAPKGSDIVCAGVSSLCMAFYNAVAEKGIREMDLIRVYSANGQDAVFAVKLTDTVQYNELYAPIHYIECNKLTPSLYDTYSKEPSYKATPIRFEKCEEV